jgi:hypothetical protein
MTLLKIEVDDYCLKEGRRRSPGWCPIAVAFRHSHGADEHDQLDVSEGEIVLENGNGDVRLVAPLPEAASQFVRDFDAGRPVKPFAFTLRFKSEG